MDKVEKYKGAERKDAVCNHLEQNHRHTWKVVNTADKFYTYFRFMSIHIEEVGVWGTEEYREICLHGIGFEVYGDVCEDWEVGQVEEISQDRVQRLEVENEVPPVSRNEMQQAQIKSLADQNERQQTQIEALLSEVESLKARVRQLESKRSAEEACLPER